MIMVLTDPIPYLGKDAFGFNIFGCLLRIHCINAVRNLRDIHVGDVTHFRSVLGDPS